MRKSKRRPKRLPASTGMIVLARMYQFVRGCALSSSPKLSKRFGKICETIQQLQVEIVKKNLELTAEDVTLLMFETVFKNGRKFERTRSAPKAPAPV